MSGPPEPRGGLRTASAEVAIVAALGLGLAAGSVALMILQYGARVRFGTADLIGGLAAGVCAAAIIRVVVRLHRRWKRSIGRITAAAALCGLAAVIGALAVLIPPHCPGDIVVTGRCGVRESAAWGQVAGLAMVLNFLVAGLALALARGVRGVLRDGSAQLLAWAARLLTHRRLNASKRSPAARPGGSRPR
ncbi:hypothetical protein [Actinomadura sp. SCN-SB]|uniref:hypothetical protein n=1 Tax=Actinomadura sp. SCN-SB TaxID=3373092 RepID=UPI00375004D5